MKKLIEDNIGVVYRVVSRMNLGSFDRDDAIGEGMIGLVEAARDFRGVGRFETFAHRCIRNQIIDAMRRELRARGITKNIDSRVD